MEDALIGKRENVLIILLDLVDAEDNSFIRKISKCLAHQLVSLRSPGSILQLCLLPLCMAKLHQISGTHIKTQT